VEKLACFIKCPHIDNITMECIVKHKKTGLKCIVVGSLNGVIYNDGERDWVNVQTGLNPIHLFTFPLDELQVSV